MDLDEFCNSVGAKFAEISEKANILYDDYWNDYVEMEFSAYPWFESLANALNSEMQKRVGVTQYLELFEYLRHAYMMGDEEIKKAIDVAFVENLFWQVPTDKAKPYWDIFPEILKRLYLSFHGRKPFSD